MGAIQNSIQLIDNVTPILRNITNSLHTVISNVQVVDNANMNPNFTGINQNLIHAENEISKMQEQIKKINKTQISPRSNFSAVTQNVGNVGTEITKIQEKINNVNKTTISPKSDFSSAVKGYEQINNNVSKVESNIKENTAAQNQFNHALLGGASAANNLNSKIMQIGGTIATYLGVSKVLALSDAYSQTTARLNLMNDNLQTTAELQNKIFASAQRARSQYQATADFVSKVGMQAKDAFKSNDEVILMAEQINKVFKISGTAQQEQASAMLQLTQALGSGVLRGEELNAVFEAAPMLIRNIADYLNVSMGEIRDMASEGQLTSDIVKKAIFASVDEVNRKFNSIPKTWADIRTAIENEANKAFWPVLNQINQIANSEKFNQFSSGIVYGLARIGSVAASVMNEVVYVGGVICNNWSFIEPVILGIVGAMVIYNGSMFTSVLATIQATGAKIAHAGASTIETAAIIGLTVAQDGFNAALALCPLTWAFYAIIGIVTGIYLVVAAYNRWTSSTISATGIIVGSFFVIGTFIYNLFAGVMNFLVNTFVIGIYNGFVDLGNFIGNVFINPVRAVVVLFMDLANTILGIIEGIAQAIDTVFGSSLASAVNNFRKNLKGWTDDIPGENKEFFKKKENIELFERIDYGSAYESGYKYGADLGSVFNMPNQNNINKNDSFNLDPASAGNLADTAKNTGKLKDSLDITEEDLKYLRDVAEQEIINRFTTAEVNVHMVNNNSINSDLDLDGIYNGLGEKIIEEVDISAEGEHK